MTARAARKDRLPPNEAGREVALDRALPAIDGADPNWQAHEQARIAEALADSRPSLPAAEAFARLDARFAAYRVKNGL